MRSRQYHVIAIALHWAIAIAIFVMIPMGLWMRGAAEQPDMAARAIHIYQIHKSLGLTILLLSVMRLAWRLFNPPPESMKDARFIEKYAAKSVHILFYGFIIIMPLTGWLYVSAQWSATSDMALEVPTLWFGWFNVPHLGQVAQASDAMRSMVAGYAISAHLWLAYGAILLILVHVGAALKHHFIDRDAILAGMVPAMARSVQNGPVYRPGSRLALRLAMAAIVLGAGMIGYLALKPLDDAAKPASAQAVPSGPQMLQTLHRAADARAPKWVVDPAASGIYFSGSHAGTPFRGEFAKWGADIRFDADDLENSAIIATIATASAADGDALHDSSLPQKEWFNVAQFPFATFESSNITPDDAGGFVMQGVLTIKDRQIPVSLPFTLTPNGDGVDVKTRVTIARKAANLGQSSDAAGQWISPDIMIEIALGAKRAAN